MSAKHMKADRNDLNTAITVGALVVAWLLYDSVQRIVQTFGSPGAVTVTTRVPAQDVTVAIGAGAPATLDSATLVAEDVNVVSVICLVLAIVLSAACLIWAAVLGVMLCRRLMRGLVFDRRNVQVIFAMSMALLAAGILRPMFENMGLNGVFAALGGEFDEHRWLLFADSIPLFIAAIALGVLVIVFRRGAALQKDTEGLV